MPTQKQRDFAARLAGDSRAATGAFHTRVDFFLNEIVDHDTQPVGLLKRVRDWVLDSPQYELPEGLVNDIKAWLTAYKDDTKDKPPCGPAAGENSMPSYTVQAGPLSPPVCIINGRPYYTGEYFMNKPVEYWIERDALARKDLQEAKNMAGLTIIGIILVGIVLGLTIGLPFIFAFTSH